MTIAELADQGRHIWGDTPMSLEQITVALGVVYGDICRQTRMYQEHGMADEAEVQKEMGNLIFSCIRWCAELGYDPEVCIRLAQDAQRRYASRLRQTPQGA